MVPTKEKKFLRTSRKKISAGVTLVGLTLLLASLTGCQTQIAGMTMPSANYLDHHPQYIPPDPPFPLVRELTTMERNSAEAGRGAGGAGGALPRPLPGAAR